MCSGVRTGAGPGAFKVALLCLLQYGAAKAAPIDARSNTDSNTSSSSKSWPCIKSMGWIRSPDRCINALVTGIVAPAKILGEILLTLSKIVLQWDASWEAICPKLTRPCNACKGSEL